MNKFAIGQRGEAVWFSIQTTCYGLIKLLESFCESEGEFEGTYFFSYDGCAHDVVDLVEKAEKFTDGETSIDYTILDTDTHDWATCIKFSDGKIVEVIEEKVEH